MITVPGDHCPLCGAELGRVRVEGRDRRYCADCDRIVWQNSKPVVGVVVVEADRVLLVERATEPYLGTWGLPGGNLEYDEHPAVGAARELAEETGVRVDLDDLDLFRADHVERGGRGVVALRYLVHREHTAGEPTPGREVSDARFATPEWFDGTEAGIAPPNGEAVREGIRRLD